MATDGAFWRDLEAQFRALPNPIRLRAIWSDGGCEVFDGPGDKRQRERLHALYRALATRAGIATGANRANAFDAWLNLLREESPHFRPFQRVENHDEGGYIENLALASAEYCIICATRAFELETAADAAAGGSPKTRAPRRGYRSEVRAYMKKHTLRTNAIAARHFGVSVDTLKSIMSTKGERRFSEDTLQGVLAKIGHKEP